MPDTKIPKKETKQPSISSFTDLNYMDDDSDLLPSAQNLDQINDKIEILKNTQNSNSSNNQIFQSKIIKKKQKNQQKQALDSSKIKRNTSQSNFQKYSSQSSKTILNKKSSQFKDIKYEQFELICRSFNYFDKQLIDFNETVLGLKQLGIQIQTQKRFQAIKNVYDELQKESKGIDFEQFAKISLKLLKDEKTKLNSDYNHIQKAYHYMLQQANHIQLPEKSEDSQQDAIQKDAYEQFKGYVEVLPTSDRYLNKQTMQNLVKYLGISKQFSTNQISSIMKCADKQNKGYLTFQDVIKCVQGNKICDV